MDDMILEIRHLSKSFGSHEVLRDIDFTVKKGDVTSIIGASGSGKSTLLRCINLLETPTSGEILYRGQNVTGPKVNAPQYRSHVGMVFQSFNLFNNMTVLENCMVGQIKVLKKDKETARKRAMEYLEKVGMAPYIQAKPRQISGGQKQRVAIARALANNPEVLLSDESTSALDPQTTKSILHLLKDLNQKLGITIVVITHEMQVVKEICDKVFVMDGGRVVESGDVFQVFSCPRETITREFVRSTSNLAQIDELLQDPRKPIQLGQDDYLVRLRYLERSTSEALISHISRQYEIDVNILLGSIELIEGNPLGGLVAVMTGPHERIRGAMEYLSRRNVMAEVISHG